MITIRNAGAFTTVQDLGRFGQLRYGIPQSGALDRDALTVANRLVGNADACAGLECTLLGPQFETDAACAIAVAGGETTLTVNNTVMPMWSVIRLVRGDRVKIGATRSGVRSYVAFSGGIDVPLVLGSRSTYVRGRLGGFDGRALRIGDQFALFAAPIPAVTAVAPELIPDYTAEPSIRVVLGPQADRFTQAGVDALLTSSYQMLPQSDRMGARLYGARVEHTRGHDIISDGIAMGSIQVPGDGQPIVLLSDRQSTGGYTKIATVCSFDIGRLAQVRPGQRLRFAAVGLDEAQRLLRAARRRLSRIAKEAS